MINSKRIIIAGGPRRGKSTLAKEYMEMGYPIYCGDPLSKVKDPIQGVTYLPEGMPFSGDNGPAQYILDNWLPLPGPWVMEGHIMPRVLSRWLENSKGSQQWPCDLIIILDRPALVPTVQGQESLHKGCMTVWNRISESFPIEMIEIIE